MRKAAFIIFFFNICLIPIGISSVIFNNDLLLNDTAQTDEIQIELLLKEANDIYTSNISEAINLSGKALKIAENLESDELIAECCFTMGKLYLYSGIFDEALIYTERAHSIFKSLNKKDKSNETIFFIGRIYLFNAEFKIAQKYFTDFYDYAISKNDTNLMIKALNSKGVIYGNTGKMDSAMILFQQIYKMAKSFGNMTFEVRSLFNMGDVLLYSDKPEEALKFYNKIEQSYRPEQIEFKQNLYLYNSTTYAYIKLGKLDSAKLYSRKTWNKLNENMLYDELKSYYEYKFQIDTLEKNYESAVNCYINYKTLSDSLKQSNFEKQLANFESLYNLEKKEHYIESLKFDVERRDMVIYGSIVIILLLGFVVVQVFRSIKKTKKTNYLLQKQKEELATANEEILAQTDDLNEKNIELEKLISKLQKTQEHLVQSEKMASIGTLTAGIAHEINNPLNYISGGLLLLNRIKDNSDSLSEDEINELLLKSSEVIDVGLERSITIIRALMTFSYDGKPILIETDLNKLIEDTLIVLNSKIDERVKIVKDFKLKEKVPVYVDKINQVILNIIDNAIYAVNIDNKAEKTIRISTEELTKSVRISVFNTGSQLSHKELKQIFDPFFTTKEAGSGTGMGLSICYNLVSEHRGTITAENINDGVLFSVKLPKKK